MLSSSVQLNGGVFSGSRVAVIVSATFLIGCIALLDWRIVGEIPLGFLYLIPMLMVGSVLNRWQIAIAAGLCTWLAEIFDDLAWNLRAGLSRDVLYFTAFFGAGLFVREVNRHRRVALKHLQEAERQAEARRLAEEQLAILIESSPAAILTADAHGMVLMANEAAHRMLGVSPGGLSGRPIHRYLPSLRNVSAPDGSEHFFRSMMQARGEREDGDTFLAEICFSTYRTDAGPRLAVMVLDTSEELRTHEVSGLHQLLAGTRLAIGAVSHEIRNVCGAIAAVHENLSRESSLAGNRDFEALGSLIAALERIASINLQQSASQPAEIDLTALLDELRIVMTPALKEEEIATHWVVDGELPMVWADRPSLMQVFLNIMTNSIRALSRRDSRLLTITARCEGEQVAVEFADNGGGVAHPEYLFRPFQEGADSSGLGLYLSRAFLRSFGGEIRYRPAAYGACFVVTLNPVV